MPADRLPPDDPRDWLNRARSNLVRAKQQAAGVYLEDLCFDAQQAAEKAVKALLIARGLEFPYVHDLVRLLPLLGDAGLSVPGSVWRAPVWRAEELTRYATTAREKSIRHGHPFILHLWWARRPLASSRAVLLALLLPDPCDPHCPVEFKAQATKILTAVRQHSMSRSAPDTSNATGRRP